jgi:hypothetical protein
MTLPLMSLYFDEYDKNNQKVLGHKTRVIALARAWQDRGGEAKLVPTPYDMYKGVLVLDSWNQYNYVFAELIVSITGTEQSPCRDADILINPSLGAEKLTYKKVPIQLLGHEYFILRHDYHNIDSTIRHQVVAIPGGNAHGFWAQVRIEDMPDSIHVMKPLSGLNFAQVLASSDVIICASGVTALEALAMGKKVLLVQTADDQELNYATAINNNWALPYSVDNLQGLLSDELAVAPNPLDDQGADRIINTIIKTWRKKHG